MMEICKVIDRLLKERNWKPKELATRCGWGVYAIYRWRAGETMPNALAMMDMADAFGVTIAEMYGRDE